MWQGRQRAAAPTGSSGKLQENSLVLDEKTDRWAPVSRDATELATARAVQPQLRLVDHPEEMTSNRTRE
eukprot:6747459-Lingulodinium_polyedra.AAC.1